MGDKYTHTFQFRRIFMKSIKTKSIIFSIIAVMLLLSCKDTWHSDPDPVEEEVQGVRGLPGGGGLGGRPGGGSPVGDTSALSGTYKSADSDADMTTTVIFSGNTLTIHIKEPMMDWDDDWVMCGYSITDGKVIVEEPIWVNPKIQWYASGDSIDDGSGSIDDEGSGGGDPIDDVVGEDRIIFTIVDDTTLRSPDGGIWTKQ
jgi:hypothetical protein